MDNKSGDSSSEGNNTESIFKDGKSALDKNNKASVINMSELQRLDQESSDIKVEVEKIKEFKTKFLQIQQQEEHC